MGPSSNVSDVAYYGVMPFSRQLRDIESSIRERRAATALPPPVSTYWRAFASPYGRDSKVRRHTTRTFKSFNPGGWTIVSVRPRQVAVLCLEPAQAASLNRMEK